MEAAGYLLDGGNLTYGFADMIRIPFVFLEERANSTTLRVYSFGHLSSKARMIFHYLLFLVPGATKSKIAAPLIWSIPLAD
jgi:hypothetical protein